MIGPHEDLRKTTDLRHDAALPASSRPSAGRAGARCRSAPWCITGIGEVVGEGQQPLRGAASRPLAHAEMEASRWRPPSAPWGRGDCPTPRCTARSSRASCAPARLLHARVARIVFATRDPKFGACGSLAAPAGSTTRLNHRCAGPRGSAGQTRVPPCCAASSSACVDKATRGPGTMPRPATAGTARRGAGVAERAGFENQCGPSAHRGFESPPLRQFSLPRQFRRRPARARWILICSTAALRRQTLL